MGKIIVLPRKKIPVRWAIEVGEEEDIWIRYVEKSCTLNKPHWRVFIQAVEIEHLQGLIEKAKCQLLAEEQRRQSGRK